MTTKASGEEIGRRGQEIYDRLRTLLETEENIGKIVSIDVESGDYEIGDDLVAAGRRLQMRHPDARMYGKRMGYNAVYAVGGSLSRLAQGTPEWEQRLWSLGKDSYGTALSLEATSREVIYEDASY